MGAKLQERLGAAFDRPAADHRDLAAAAWPVLATAETDRIFALFFEANGLAAVGREPYTTLVPALVGAWVEWTAAFVEGDDTTRRAEAEATIALLDGLLLVRLLAGADAADRAAATLGLTTPESTNR
jgi:hypothetical protein